MGAFCYGLSEVPKHSSPDHLLVSSEIGKALLTLSHRAYGHDIILMTTVYKEERLCVTFLLENLFQDILHVCFKWSLVINK